METLLIRNDDALNVNGDGSILNGLFKTENGKIKNGIGVVINLPLPSHPPPSIKSGVSGKKLIADG